MFKDFNNEEEKKSDFICISLILGNAVLYRFPRKQALRTKGISPYIELRESAAHRELFPKNP